MKLLMLLFPIILLLQHQLYGNPSQDSEQFVDLFGERFAQFNQTILAKALEQECFTEEPISEFSLGFLCNVNSCDNISSNSLEHDDMITKNCEMLQFIDSLNRGEVLEISGELEETPELSALNHLYESYTGGARTKTHDKDGLLAFEYRELNGEGNTIVNVVDVKGFGDKSFIRIAESVYTGQGSNLSHYFILLRYSKSCNCLDGIWVLGTFDLSSPKNNVVK